MQLLANNMAAKYVHATGTRHLHTPFAHAINKTPYVILYWFSVKITPCMYILCGIRNTVHEHFIARQRWPNVKTFKSRLEGGL